MLQALYDAIHAVALTNAGATSLMHEARACRAVADMLKVFAKAGTFLRFGMRSDPKPDVLAVDVVTVPNLSEHLSSAATTQQLSARVALILSTG